MVKRIVGFFFLLLSVCLAVAAHAQSKSNEDVIKAFLTSQETHEPGMEEAAQSMGNAIADLDGDGKDEIILVWTTLGPTYWRNTLTVFSIDGEKEYKPASSFALEGAAENPSVKNGVILVEQVLYAKTDPICCPTIKKQMKYRWDKKGITIIDQ
ncbi:MAG: hypothetical protein DI551_05035 [Micavibrio aeruginosavorus]|uniref:VCBS repeat-containing protein n=1 Tax=Micavibrio aeruginosavorus TaxID=349221 RepID=A0A2W5MYW8_9BACT|nr:MAG: hypothetical protein DI551_05035 [Micavibrio aeruginosavorus]